MSDPFGEVPALPVVIPFALIVFGLLLWRLRAGGRASVPRATVAAALSIYAAGIVANTIFPIYLRLPDSDEPWAPHVALVPFRDYEVADAVTNVAVFIPLGVLLPLLLARPTWPRVVGIAAATSLGIELAQLAGQGLFGGGHIADLDDFVFNTIGAAIGYGILQLVTHVPGARPVIDRFRWARPPIMAAGGVVFDESGRLLLVLRTKDPEAGCWSVPGGRVEPGETLEEAVVREVHEETGIVVTTGPEVWSLTQPVGDGRSYEIHDFVAEPIGGHLRAGDDAGDARWFTPREVEEAHLTRGLLHHLERAGLHTPTGARSRRPRRRQ